MRVNAGMFGGKSTDERMAGLGVRAPLSMGQAVATGLACAIKGGWVGPYTHRRDCARLR